MGAEFLTNEAELIAGTESHEGYKANPYVDSLKRWTWGMGDCLETNPPSGPEWKYLLDNKLVDLSITKQGAEWLMQRRLDPVAKQLAIDFADFWPQLNDARQNALAELAFQIGVRGEEAFHDMIAAIRTAVRTGAWGPVKVAGMASEWARETPSRAQIVLDQLCTGQFASRR